MARTRQGENLEFIGVSLKQRGEKSDREEENGNPAPRYG